MKYRKGIASTSWINTIGIEKFSGGLDNNKTSYTVTSTKLILGTAIYFLHDYNI